MDHKLKTPQQKVKKTGKRVKLQTWEEVARYKAEHLAPRGYGPKGRPIYDFDEVCKLNLDYPDEH